MSDSKSYKSVSNTSGGIYGLAFIGSLIYYLMNASGFWSVMYGIVKALLWPAFLIYEIMSFLQM